MLLITTSALLLLFLSSGATASSPYMNGSDSGGGPAACEPLRVPQCQSLGYTYTRMPSVLNIKSQRQAEYVLDSFKPLLQYGCSAHLRVLLCAYYAPMCSPLIGGGVIVPPCQSLCTTVMQQCMPVLSLFGYPWPIDCSILPKNNTRASMCMEAPYESIYSTTSPTVERSQQCPGLNYSSQDKEFASVWLAIWSVVCCGVTLFCFVSFILSYTRYGVIDAGAFTYPDRCCVFIIICYFMVSVGYLTRVALGPTVPACIGSTVHPVQGYGLHMTSSCILVFILVYYFTNAAAIWWTIMCWCWLMQAWKRCYHHQLLRWSAWMHLLAWGAPSVLTISILANRSTELQSDDLMGMCYPGNRNSRSLMQWVLAPQLLLIFSGTTLMLLTFACLYREHLALNRTSLRNNFARASQQRASGKFSRITAATSCQTQPQQQQHQQQQEEVLISPLSLSPPMLKVPARQAARVGVIALLYMLPTVSKVGALYKESKQRLTWISDPQLAPSIEVLMFRIFVSLAPGILLSLFLANIKVMHSWRQLGRKLYEITGNQHCQHSQECSCNQNWKEEHTVPSYPEGQKYECTCQDRLDDVHYKKKLALATGQMNDWPCFEHSNAFNNECVASSVPSAADSVWPDITKPKLNEPRIDIPACDTSPTHLNYHFSNCMVTPVHNYNGASNVGGKKHYYKSGQ